MAKNAIEKLNDKLESLIDEREEIRLAEGALRIKKAAYEKRRTEVLEEMRKNNLENMRTNKATVTVSTSTNVKVVDPGKAIGWLKANKFVVEDYLTLNTPMVKKLAEGRFTDKDYGEIMDGVEISASHVLSIRYRKEKELNRPSSYHNAT